MYFKVRYQGSNKTDILNLSNSVQVGKVYRDCNTGITFKVISKVNFKYTLNDLDILRVVTEGYDSGIYYDICQIVLRALAKGVPNVRFSSYEKEHIAMIIEHENIPEFKDALKRIVGDKYYE